MAESSIQQERALNNRLTSEEVEKSVDSLEDSSTNSPTLEFAENIIYCSKLRLSKMDVKKGAQINLNYGTGADSESETVSKVVHFEAGQNYLELDETYFSSYTSKNLYVETLGYKFTLE